MFHEDPFFHTSTFVGAEVRCPVASTVLEVSSRSDFLRRVTELGAFLSASFERLKEKHPRVLVGLRRLGLTTGIRMANEHCGPLFSKCACDSGLLSVYACNDPRIAQLLPPATNDRGLAGGRSWSQWLRRWPSRGSDDPREAGSLLGISTAMG